ncbi:MAG: hypothetical protein MI865_13220 [Proteobacteria bacterium]|nr:hypothetical protein [Pseudomonadota bacterium]
MFIRNVESIAIFVFLLLVSGCSESLNHQAAVEKYIKVCTEASTTRTQIDSCHCMALEYDKVLDKKEYDAFTAMMEITAKKTRFMAKGQPGMKMPLGTTGVDERALVSAMKKMQPLHKSGVCGYGS